MSMSPNDVVQCPNCGCLRLRYQMDEVFTGRKIMICYECKKGGLVMTGDRLERKKTKKARGGRNNGKF